MAKRMLSWRNKLGFELLKSDFSTRSADWPAPTIQTSRTGQMIQSYGWQNKQRRCLFACCFGLAACSLQLAASNIRRSIAGCAENCAQLLLTSRAKQKLGRALKGKKGPQLASCKPVSPVCRAGQFGERQCTYGHSLANFVAEQTRPNPSEPNPNEPKRPHTSIRVSQTRRLVARCFEPHVKQAVAFRRVSSFHYRQSTIVKRLLSLLGCEFAKRFASLQAADASIRRRTLGSYITHKSTAINAPTVKPTTRPCCADPRISLEGSQELSRAIMDFFRGLWHFWAPLMNTHTHKLQ